MSKQQLAHILEISAQNPPPPDATPPAMRAWAEAVTSHTPLADHVTVCRSSFGPHQGDLILPDGGDASRLIIYYHGGGFFLFSPRTYRVTTTNLARASGVAVFAPDYRLAPENPAPAAHDDAFGVYQSALKQGYAADRIALGGDSAGGNLALATVLRAREAGLPLPSALVLFSPWLDFAEEGATYRSISDDPILPTMVLDGFKQAYLRDGDFTSSTVTPFYDDFRGLPTTLVHVGSWERLRDDSVTLVERMKAADVRAELKTFDGMCHGWQLFAPMLEEGMASIEQAAHFIKAQQAPEMSAVSWAQALTLALAAFFVVGFVINTFMVKKVGPEYHRWGYPDWFHFVSGGLELFVALLLPAMATRLFGVALGSAIMLAAIATVVWHREYRRAAPPLIVFILLVIIGATAL